MDNEKILIECECGTHLLKVECDKEPDSNEVRFYLAMFHYGLDNHKPKLWDRIKFCFKYIWDGKMYSDQLSLSSDEATKLTTFLNNNGVGRKYTEDDLWWVVNMVNGMKDSNKTIEEVTVVMEKYLNRV